MSFFTFGGAPTFLRGTARRVKVRRARRRHFQPVGRTVTLGDPVPGVVDYGATRKATIIVGLNKGRSAQNNRGDCAVVPMRLTPTAVDQVFIEERAFQVGPRSVGASRTVGKGWYKSKPEASVAYDVVFIPGNRRERSYAKFEENIDRLAKAIGRRACQDEVLVIHDDSDKRKTKSARRLK